MEEVWRDPTAAERNLLERLLSVDFPGGRQLASQVKRCLVRQLDLDGSLAFRVDASDFASVKRRVPVEAEAVDSDGVVIHALLHVVDGLVTELEICKEDGSAILQFPGALGWELVDLG